MNMCRFHCGSDDHEYQKVVKALVDDILLKIRRQNHAQTRQVGSDPGGSLGQSPPSAPLALNVRHGPYSSLSLGQSVSSDPQYQHNIITGYHLPLGYLPTIVSSSEQQSGPSAQQYVQVRTEEALPDMKSAALPSALDAERKMDIRSQVESKIEQEIKEKMVGLLKFDELGARMADIRPAQMQTCQWFLTNSAYTTWKNGNEGLYDSGFLWIKGKPGTGKSTLMKYLHSVHSRQANCRVVSFFFNARGAELEKLTLGCYRALLFLLLGGREDLWKAMNRVDKAGRSYIVANGWNTGLLTETFKNAVELVAQQQPVECWIDALDECQDSEVEQMVSFFEDLNEFMLSKGLPFRACFASRHYPNIVAKKAVEIVLEEEPHHEDDIAKYFAAKLRLDNYVHKSDIESKILNMPSNIFLWVVLVIPILNQAYARGKIPALSKCLSEVPRDLDALFHSILTRDEEDTQELLRCLQWILCSIIPLQPLELYTAMQLSTSSYSNEHFEAVDPLHSSGCTSCDDKMSTKELQYYVNSVSKGLAEVTTSSTVQFIHESVGDFLLGRSGRSDLLSTIKGFQFGNPGEIHESLKHVCLDHIITAYSAIFSDDSSDSLVSSADHAVKHGIGHYSFLSYAVTNVLLHADQAYHQGISQSVFLQNFPIHKLTCLYNALEGDEGSEDVEGEQDEDDEGDQDEDDGGEQDEDDEGDKDDNVEEVEEGEEDEENEESLSPSMLYLLAQFDAHHLLRDHPELHQQFKLRCGDWGYPWMVAAWNGNTESLRHLVNATGTSSSSSLSLQEVDSLLKGMYRTTPDRDPHPSVRFKEGDSATAARLVAFGHGPLLETFLLQISSRHCECQGSPKEVQTQTQSDPCPTMVQRIVNCRFADDGSTAIFWARTAEALEVLLAYGTNPKAQRHGGQTVLHNTVGKNEDETGMEQLKAICSVQQVKLKLPSLRCSIEPTMENGTEDDLDGIFHSLTPGFDINSQDDWGWTALNVVSGAEPGYSSDDGVVPLLLDTFPDIDIHLRDRRGMFPLLWAVVEGYGTTVDLLLRRYTESDLHHLNRPDNDGRNIVSYAAEHNRYETDGLRLLLAKFPEIDLDTPDNQGWTPLRWALDFGYEFNEEPIWLLLQTNKVNPFHGLGNESSPFQKMVRDAKRHTKDGEYLALDADKILLKMIEIRQNEEIMGGFQLKDEEICRIQEEVAEVQKLLDKTDVEVAEEEEEACTEAKKHGLMSWLRRMKRRPDEDSRTMIWRTSFMKLMEMVASLLTRNRGGASAMFSRRLRYLA